MLKPGGRLSLLFRSSDTPAVAAFPPEVYRFRSLDEVTDELARGGFDREDAVEAGDCILLTARRRGSLQGAGGKARSSGV